MEKYTSLMEAVTTWALAGLPMADKEVITNRLNTCNACEQVVKNKEGEPYKCTACGCYLQWKVLLETSTCPENKWGS